MNQTDFITEEHSMLVPQRFSPDSAGRLGSAGSSGEARKTENYDKLLDSTLECAVSPNHASMAIPDERKEDF